MAKEGLDEIQELTHNSKHIRNIGIVAHIDHGKTTLTDNLLARAGMISDKLAGQQLFMDYDDQEQERGITIYAANVSMVHEYEDERYLVNLIDTPGHVDFGGDVTRAMRAVDGALVVVDAVDGVMPQTETVLRQAIEERVRPVLFINKVDRLIKELKLEPEKIRERFIEIIAEVNRLIDPKKQEWKVSAKDGTAAFGSALYNWAISLPYMKKTGIDFQQIKDRVDNDQQEKLGKEAPLHEVTLDMVIKHLPNPNKAQTYRIPEVWPGDIESDNGQSMKDCNEDGPMICLVTNVESDPHAGTICTARLFSGTVEEGETLYGIGSRSQQRVQQVGIYSGPRKLKVPEVPAGNILALTGVDYATGETVVEEDLRIKPFEQIEHIFEPVVTKSIEPVKTSQLPKLIEALRKRAKEDNTIKVDIDEETGETLVSGLGELHIEAKIERYLQEQGIKINVSEPIVVFRETVSEASPEREGISPNRHNRFKITVEPLEEGAYEVLDEEKLPEGKVRTQDEQDVRDTLTEADMDKEEAENVKDIYKNNLFLDMTRGIQYLHEIDELLLKAFHNVVDEGPLANESCTGLKVKIHDAKLHEDAIHRGPAQVIPAVRDAITQCMLAAGAKLLEPVQVIRIDCPSDQMGNAMTEVSNRRGKILNMEEKERNTVIHAKLPVGESFGFEADLKSATTGKGFYSLEDQVFEPLPSNLQEETILEIRKRKGMKEEVPQIKE